MDDAHARIFMDLSEVTLVDVEVVRFLIECEGGSIMACGSADLVVCKNSVSRRGHVDVNV